MALTLIDGKPGNGKTLFVVSEINKRFAGREIYYYNIPGLLLPWTPLDDPFKWMDVPTGSVVVIDECHQVFPLRMGGKDIPQHVEAVATHRHRGVDLVFVTQDVMGIDKFVRQRCNEHIRLSRSKVGAKSANVITAKEELVTETENLTVVPWKYPTDSFANYRSAEVHTDRVRLPKGAAVYGLLIVLGIGLFSFLVVRAFNGVGGGAETEVAGVVVDPDLSRSITGVNRSVQDVSYKLDALRADWLVSQVPRLAKLPHTAPQFDDLMEPRSAPVPKACIQRIGKWPDGGIGCSCYTSQATLIDIDERICMQTVAYGFFDATRETGL